MSTQRGNTSKKRTQKHNNNHTFKNDKYDSSKKIKSINELNVSNVCQRCKDCIEWKIKYKKYKPRTVPGKWWAFVSKCMSEKNHSEAVTRRCSIKKGFLEISQNSQGSICTRVSFLIKFQASTWPANLLKMRLWHRCFPVNFAKFLRTSFLTERLRWLLLNN